MVTPSPDARADPADVMRPVPFLVQRNQRETQDTCTLTFSPANASPFRFAPGQFNMVYLYGVGEVPLAISGDPTRTSVISHTVRAVGAVTQALSNLERGDFVGVRGPFGTSWPVAQAQGRDVVIVAGGIGLAPLRPAILHILAHRGLYGKVAVLYGARTSRDILYARELSQWRGRFDLEVAVTVDRATADWQGAVGVVNKLIDRGSFDPANAVAMICGPEVMMRFTLMGLERRGVSSANVHLCLERNMECAAGFCGHCQIGPLFACRDGPVFRHQAVRPFLGLREG